MELAPTLFSVENFSKLKISSER